MRRGLAWIAAASALGWGVTGLVAPGTVAPFIDTGAATGSFITGVLDLLLSDDDEPFKNNLATHTWVLTDVLPDDPQVCGNVQLKNEGTVEGSAVSIDLLSTGTGGVPLESEIMITSLLYNGTPILGSVADGDGHPGVSVHDLELQGGISGLSGLHPPPPHGINGTKSFSMCLQLHADATSALMGLTWLGTFTFTLHQ